MNGLLSRETVRKALRLPPRVLASRAAAYVERRVGAYVRRRRDAEAQTYLDPSREPGELLRYFPPLPVELLRPRAGEVLALARRYREHRFDLLGSGWVQVRHGLRCRGLEGHRWEPGPPVEADPGGRWLEGRINPANLRESQRIWSLVDPGYAPIDWQLDFRSGYRWSEGTWYADVPHGHAPGADIKVPWELARMQHLPQLAWAWTLARGDGAAGEADGYLREFRNQVLDFLAANPPRFGVNWRSTMDVAIRAVNLLAAYDLFRAGGASLDREWEATFRKGILEHGLHVAANLEWTRELRGNHYFSHVLGLLFVAAYLPRSPGADAWLALGVQELVREVARQFHPDGSNFEASTSYHRLSAEGAVYATALVLGLPAEKRAALREYDARRWRGRPPLAPAPVPLHALPGAGEPVPFPAWYVERIERMAEFAVDATRPDGRVAQFGDNDSARFLRLFPVHARLDVAGAKRRYGNLEGYGDLPDDAEHPDEEHLDHRHLVAAVNGLFGRADLAAWAAGAGPEGEVVRGLAGGARLPAARAEGTAASGVRLPAGAGEPLPEGRHEHRFRFPGGDLREGLRCAAYPDFGLWVFRSRRVYLAVRCGAVGQEGNGGHAHNDQLSLELMVDGEEVLADPGSRVYTALPATRNAYRSDWAHFGFVSAERESAGLAAGLFTLDGDPRARCLEFSEAGFLGVHDGFGARVARRVRIEPEAVVVEDRVPATGAGGAVSRFAAPADRGRVPLSPGYGKHLRPA